MSQEIQAPQGIQASRDHQDLLVGKKEKRESLEKLASAENQAKTGIQVLLASQEVKESQVGPEFQALMEPEALRVTEDTQDHQDR